MTFATDKGFEVGQKFIYNGGGIGNGFNAGDVVTLDRDDRTDCPQFKRDKDGEKQYLSLSSVTPARITPALEAGFVVGKSYRIIGGYPGDHDFPVGTVVKFTVDDGSGCPRFEGKNDSGDGWHYPLLKNVSNTPVDVDALAADMEEETEAATAFSVIVSATQTDIIIGKPLTAAEVAKVLEAAGVK